jgi:hypothetical protein
MSSNIFTSLPNEILSTIIYLEDLPNFLLTCKYFAPQINIIQIITSYTHLYTFPKFLLMPKWTNIIYSKNPNFILPANYILEDPQYIFLNLIYKNSINGIKLINNQLDNSIYDIPVSIFGKYHEIEDIFGIFPDNATDIKYNQIPLIFAYKFGSEDMLKLLLDNELLEDIKNNYVYEYSHLLGNRKREQIGSLINIIKKLEKKNNWNTKSQVYKRISGKLLLDLIINNEFDIIQEILINYDQILINKLISNYIIDFILDYTPLSLNIAGIFSNICKLYGESMKIKHQILLIADLFSTKDMTEKIYESFLWSEEDIDTIKLIMPDFNL